MIVEALPHGSRLERAAGQPVRILDRNGHTAFLAAWEGSTLLQARFRIPDGREVVVRPRAAVHPILGPCHQVTLGDERPLSLFAAVDLARPDHIPAMDLPAALPPGAGTAILGFVARQARDAGIDRLRYRGPYPTGALFDALIECFTVPEVARSAARFVEDAEAIALAGRSVEVPVDFAPAPFERVWQADVCVQLRDGVERAWVDGHGYSRLVHGARAIVPEDAGWAAALVLGGSVWTVVARFDPAGSVVERLSAVRPPPARLCGVALPPSIRQAMRQILPPRAPELLRDALEAVLRDTPIAWGDPGLDVAAIREGGIVLHAGLLERLASLPPERILAEIADALDEPARRLALRAFTGLRGGHPSGRT